MSQSEQSFGQLDLDNPRPKILVPYLGPGKLGQMDIVVYLRPETNGVDVESTLFRELRAPAYVDHFQLVYLANLPGLYLRNSHVINDHYHQRIRFAQEGSRLFTPEMISRFERFFGEKFDHDLIIGAFEALEEFEISADQLMDLWVPVYDLLEVHGQLIKRHPKGKFVVNYDIPGILAKYQEGTDVAAMVLRTDFKYEQFLPVIHHLGDQLVESQLLDPSKPIRRIFHYSKGPFEQILDTVGFLLRPNGQPESPDQTQFFQYLKAKGCDERRIWQILKNPIVRMKWKGKTIEENLLIFTQGHNFKSAYKKFCAVEEVIQL
jgi:hypothetical protein